jgi:signal transduction histidine kinase
VAAYYVAAEALANANKHAHASVIRINATGGDRWLHLSIADNGAGGADPTRGSGLIGLIDRVDAMGGTIMINSPIGQGTDLQIKLPIRSQH